MVWLRLIRISAIAATIGYAVASGSWAAGWSDTDAIEKSRAGIAERQPTKFIMPIPDHWADDMMETRYHQCGEYQMALAEIDDMFSRGDLSSNDIESIVEKWLSPLCLVTVFTYEKIDNSLLALITPEGDYVFEYERDRAFTPWAEVDHLETRFDAIAVDYLSTVGIAPAGEVADNPTFEYPQFDDWRVPIPMPRSRD